MAQTPSNMIPLGTAAPDFRLKNVLTNTWQTLDELQGQKGTVIAFICNHCPFVKHILDEFIHVAERYREQGVAFIAISSNDVEHYPDDSPEKMAALAREKQFPFPYLFDETQDTAKAYQAACTPDFYLFDATLCCVYRGQFDNARPGSAAPVTGRDLCHALDALVSGQPISDQQIPSIGCNIKWREE